MPSTWSHDLAEEGGRAASRFHLTWGRGLSQPLFPLSSAHVSALMLFFQQYHGNFMIEMELFLLGVALCRCASVSCAQTLSGNSLLLPEEVVIILTGCLCLL